MLVVTVRFETKPDCVEEFREAILFQARSSRENEEGCRQFDVCQSIDEPTVFSVYEVYHDEAAFEAHKTSPHSAITRERIGDLLASRDLKIWTRISE
ncbi:Autoinducer 2-degrading protein LsrG [Thalassoglobus neptunius]|uniref:Autoinducer 2-degrading protein LsrG n=1 Tax=Thalassoglobus neptunius TaxID=1938619 RepID=A0A5C5VP01_9PLAN|nr:putative quinol monooxygenase [Thalassoglobus neptunius]TWT39847.1 Autoinducer 2-degrading protein LsrG [Thalassoglobus neptunius]